MPDERVSILDQSGGIIRDGVVGKPGRRSDNTRNLNSSRSKPGNVAVKANSGAVAWRAAWIATDDESRPPLSSTPTGTSALRRSLTASAKMDRNASSACRPDKALVARGMTSSAIVQLPLRLQSGYVRPAADRCLGNGIAHVIGTDCPEKAAEDLQIGYCAQFSRRQDRLGLRREVEGVAELGQSSMA